MTYCITYILSCITKHSPQYKVLMIGRILGGIATSLLFSAFESWLVAEHNKVRHCFSCLSMLFKYIIYCWLTVSAKCSLELLALTLFVMF